MADDDSAAAVAATAALADELNQIPAEHIGPISFPDNPALEEAINALLARFAAQFADRQGWLASTAHDLRSPITAIIANAELAMDSLATDDDMAYAVKVAHRNATRLAVLMDTMMEEATALGGSATDRDTTRG